MALRQRPDGNIIVQELGKTDTVYITKVTTDAETSARVSADSTLQTNINTETTSRQTATDLNPGGGTSLLNVNGFARIVSPMQGSGGNPSDSIATAGTLDCSAQHIFFKNGGPAASAYTVTLSNMSEGQTVTLLIKSTGFAYTITWQPAGSLIWGPSSTPVPTAIAGKYDVYTFVKIGGWILGSAIVSMA